MPTVRRPLQKVGKKFSKPKARGRTTRETAQPTGAQLLARRNAALRIQQITELIDKGNYPSIDTIAAKLGSSWRTVHRDITTMRDDLKLPLAYHETKWGWYFTEPVKGMPLLRITMGELVALCIARQALESYRLGNFAPKLLMALEKLTQSMGEDVSFHWEQLRKVISFRTSGVGVKVNVRTLEAVSTALTREYELEFRYKGIGSNEATPRRVRPQHLAFVNDGWYLLAVDPARNFAIRTFAISRITRARMTSTGFERLKKFDPAKYLTHSIGIHAGGKPARVRLRCKGVAARLVSERDYHASQKVTALSEDSVEVTMEVAINPELERLVLGFGAEVEVIEPADLREAVRRNAEAMLAAHR
jgi:predicted DNA-binding transcriptional regulator YafY